MAHFFWPSGTICATFVKGIMRNIYKIYFEFGFVVQEMLFKDISYLQLWRPYIKQNSTFCASLVEDNMGNIHVIFFRIWTSGLGESCLDISYLQLWQPISSAEWDHLH